VSSDSRLAGWARTKRAFNLKFHGFTAAGALTHEVNNFAVGDSAERYTVDCSFSIANDGAHVSDLPDFSHAVRYE
jgi:hypothetical protein